MLGSFLAAWLHRLPVGVIYAAAKPAAEYWYCIQQAGLVNKMFTSE